VKIDIPKGKYVVAVSGGVDSVVLLDLLSKMAGLDLIVAHLDHGIRQTSANDASFVNDLAKGYGLPFVLGKAHLAPAASEAAARDSRYEFLKATKEKLKADAVVTAHHQDDLIETALLNMLRGTSHSGLVAMINNRQILRPLLNITKGQIIEYAKVQKLRWVEDETNQSDNYLRNRVRKYASNMDQIQKSEILNNISEIESLNKRIGELTKNVSKTVFRGSDVIDRAEFIKLPTPVGNEVLYSWLKGAGIKDIDRRLIERLAMSIKTARPATKSDVKDGYCLAFTVKTAHLSNTLH
jgi:tRNA(Ile)-lysidine synthetase-like protein